jgi:hypothetical protein
VHPVGPDAARDRDDRPDPRRVIDGEFQRHRGAHAMPEDVRTVDVEVVQQTDDVLGQRGWCDGSLDVGRSAVPLHLNTDDQVRARERRDQPGKVQVDRHHPAVQQNQRAALPVHLVVHVHAADVGKPAAVARLCVDGVAARRGAVGHDEVLSLSLSVPTGAHSVGCRHECVDRPAPDSTNAVRNQPT